MSSDHGARDCDLDGAAPPNSHHLDIFAPGRMIAVAISAINVPFDGEHQTLKGAHRRIAHAYRGIIGKRDFTTTTGEQSFQVLRARLNEFVNNHIILCVQCVQVRAKP